MRVNSDYVPNGTVVFYKGVRLIAHPRAFGDAQVQQLISGPTYSVQFTQVSGSPDNSSGAANATPGGTNGDPGQTFKDFKNGVSGLGTAPDFPGVPSSLLSALQGYFKQAEADVATGDKNTPLEIAAQNAANDLNNIAAQCVLYQQWDQPFGRSNTRGDIYANWLNTLVSHMQQAQAAFATAAATEASQITGQSYTKTAGGATYNTPGGPTGASVAPQQGALQFFGSTTGGVPTWIWLVGGIVLLGGGAYWYKRRHRASPAPTGALARYRRR